MTYIYVGHHTERLMREVPRLLLLALQEVDNVEFVGEVALFGYQGHAARASRQRESVKLECHGKRRG
jgi:hypothetical protein